MTTRSFLAAGVLSLVWAVGARGAYTHFLEGDVLPGDSGWVVDGDAGTLVDLGGGNFGIQQIDDTPGGPGGGDNGGAYDEFYIEHGNPTATLNARFRLDSYAFESDVDPYPQTLIALTPQTNNPGPSVALGIRNVEGVDHWVALQFLHEANGPLLSGLLADLGPVVTGAFNVVGLHTQNEPGGDNDIVRVFWNGAEVYNGPGVSDWNGGPGYAEFGASNYWGEGGTSTVTYDWVGFGPGYIAVPEPGGALLTLAALCGAVGFRRVRAKRRES